LAAQPKNVELGEWLAHQCESYRIAHISTKLRLNRASGRDESTSHRDDPGYSRG
jgi:hypothetical protein